MNIFIAAAVLLLAINLAGCVHTASNTTALDNNLLNKPISFELLAGDASQTTKSYDEFFTIVTRGLDSYMTDDFGRKKIIETAKKLYPEYNKLETELNGKGQGKSNLEKIKDALQHSFMSRHERQMDALEDLRQMGFGKNLETIYSSTETTLKNGTQGQGNYRISLYNQKNRTNYTPAVDVSVDLNYNVRDGKIIVDVTGISYKANRITVNNEMLVKMLEGASPTPVSTPNAFYFREKIKEPFTRRFSSRHESTNKTEHTYKVDFATAKARLQRALGNFKYDNDKSSFLIEKVYENPSPNGKGSIKHRFIISLFPDRNDTVVEFSGDYGYYADSFGGPEKFGKAEYDFTMSSYMSVADGILKK